MDISITNKQRREEGLHRGLTVSSQLALTSACNSLTAQVTALAAMALEQRTKRRAEETELREAVEAVGYMRNRIASRNHRQEMSRRSGKEVSNVFTFDCRKGVAVALHVVVVYALIFHFLAGPRGCTTVIHSACGSLLARKGQGTMIGAREDEGKKSPCSLARGMNPMYTSYCPHLSVYILYFPALYSSHAHRWVPP